MKVIRLECKAMFDSPVLGSASANKDLYGEFLGSRSGDADKLQEELEALPAEELVTKGTTVFLRNADGECMLFDYQVEGMLKENCAQLTRMPDSESKKVKAWRKQMLNVHVHPRQIVMTPPEPITEMEHHVRPLRIEDWKNGDRTALAASEKLPAGTTFAFQVETPPHLLKPTLEWLQHGKNNGLGQWRNGGFGQISVEVIGAEEIEGTVDEVHKKVQGLLKDK